jgi:putative ABC transport system substrate-binding protein
MKRREFIGLIGGAVAWPVVARAQQPGMPVIGFLHLTSQDETRGYLPDFHQGLADSGYMEGKNVAIEYRWGEGRNDQLPSLIAELVRRQVSVIVTLESTLAALAAKQATNTIPIIFMQGADPVRIGLVDSLSRPGGNLTGINLFLAEVAAKRLEFLLVLVPGVKSVAYLRNPTNPIFAESETREVEAAARSFGVRLVFNASDSSGIERAFREIVQQRMDALFVSADGFLLTRSEQIVTLASWTGVPAAYGWRQAVTRGGLLSYGEDFHASWRQAGIYTGRILKGEQPSALPVQQVHESRVMHQSGDGQEAWHDRAAATARSRRRGD